MITYIISNELYTVVAREVTIIVNLVKKAMKEHDRPILIGIGGAGSSGKTTLALQLLKKFPKKDIGLLNLDGYYKDLSYRRRIGWTGANPKSVKINLLKKHLKFIRSGKSFEVPKDKVNKEECLYQKIYKPMKINLIDGFSGMMSPFLEFYDVKVFITCPENLQMERRLERDVNIRNRSLVEIRKIFHLRNRDFKKYILPNKKFGDIVLKAKKKGFSFA